MTIRNCRDTPPIPTPICPAKKEKKEDTFHFVWIKVQDENSCKGGIQAYRYSTITSSCHGGVAEEKPAKRHGLDIHQLYQ
jgi:hypothetical protein